MKRIFSGSGYRAPALVLALSGTVAVGCGEQASVDSLGETTQAIASYPDLLVPTGVSMMVNTQIALAADAQKGDRVLSATVADLSALQLNAGDLVMIHQAQGAQIASTDDAGYGAVTNLGSAGQYEVFRVSGSNAATGQIQIAPGCGLRNAYSAAGKTQLVRVPRYHNVSVQAGLNGVAPGSIVARPWNGTSGGIVAFKADTVTVDGNINASGRGFRGGNPNNSTSNAAVDQTQYRSTLLPVGAEKGESVAGSQADYDAIGGRIGRGAPANGGGGGNNTNSGGGGGANVSASGAYTGDGVMGNTTMFQAAWKLDPYYVANQAFSASAGGGRGGYTYSSALQDPATVGPGNALWAGNNRREHGGRGGHALTADVMGRLFFGGGGGGGEADMSNSGMGGAGGGIALVLAKQLTTDVGGGIFADGAPGGSSTLDGAGGGGGGGSVVVSAGQLNGVHIDAFGGKGGDNPTTTNFILGPGGAGGGGFIAVPMGLAVEAQVGGGVSGVSSGPSVATFPMNGATNGSAGMVASYTGLLPVCLPADLSIGVTRSEAVVRINVPVHYVATVTNQGPEEAENLKVTVSVPDGTTVASDPSGDGWTCTLGTGSYTCSFASLTAGASAPVLRYIMAARPESPTQIVSTVEVTSDHADPSMDNNSGSVMVDIDRSEIHGNGFSCSATGTRAPASGAGIFGFLFLISALLFRARRVSPQS